MAEDDDAREFLDDIREAVTEPPAVNRIGTVDSGYSSGRPRVLFDGETTMGQKTYAYLASYTPVASHRVLLAPVGTGFVVVGRIV